MTGTSYTETTRGIAVTVEPVFLADQSDPEINRFVWAYRVCICNNGPQTVKLLRRKWRITDGHGQTVEVEGQGVVGETPTLEPGETFEYTSGTPLNTPTGFMQGWYHMTDPATGDTFDVAIPVFSLDSLYCQAVVH